MYRLLGINMDNNLVVNGAKPTTEDLHYSIEDKAPDLIFSSEFEIEALSKESNKDYEICLQKFQFYNQRYFPNFNPLDYPGLSFEQADNLVTALVPKYKRPYFNDMKQTYQGILRKKLIYRHKKQVFRERETQKILLGIEAEGTKKRPKQNKTVKDKSSETVTTSTVVNAKEAPADKVGNVECLMQSSTINENTSTAEKHDRKRQASSSSSATTKRKPKVEKLIDNVLSHFKEDMTKQQELLLETEQKKQKEFLETVLKFAGEQRKQDQEVAAEQRRKDQEHELKILELLTRK